MGARAQQSRYRPLAPTPSPPSAAMLGILPLGEHWGVARLLAFTGALTLLGLCGPPRLAAEETRGGTAAQETAMEEQTLRERILITAFYDWRDLGEPPALDRCRENPSCRLLAGVGRGPRGLRGPLAERLQRWAEGQPQRSLELRILPVTWGSAEALPIEDYEKVIHLGLGVYDSHHKILIEDGAYNLRRGRDAAGATREEPIDPGAAAILAAPAQIRAKLQRALDAQLPSPFFLERAPARERNSYLCNETHYRSLATLKGAAQGALREAYFVHIPYSEGADDTPLAAALERLLITLIEG